MKVPVATIGGLNDPAQMEEIIASGQADVVYMGRALLADHMLPRKVMANQPEEIVHCLRCFTCMAEHATFILPGKEKRYPWWKCAPSWRRTPIFAIVRCCFRKSRKPA